jgi:1L-myo-inositol 1-phosphate cytidylyltransferase
LSSVSSSPVRDAVILAAGNGDRFKNPDHHSKLLHPVLGQPLILRTLETAAAAGLTHLHVVVGFEADRVKSVITQNPIRGVAVDFVYNPDWHLENGVSALAARAICTVDRFVLMMGDHLFESGAVKHLISQAVVPGCSVLAIDTTQTDPQIIDEATRVQLDGHRIVAIGKGLEPWDAIDTGLFIFTPELFSALEDAQRAGQTTLSAGVQRLARRGRMLGVPIAVPSWCDVDTVDDLAAAESRFAEAAPEPA